MNTNQYECKSPLPLYLDKPANKLSVVKQCLECVTREIFQTDFSFVDAFLNFVYIYYILDLLLLVYYNGLRGSSPPRVASSWNTFQIFFKFKKNVYQIQADVICEPSLIVQVYIYHYYVMLYYYVVLRVCSVMYLGAY